MSCESCWNSNFVEICAGKKLARKVWLGKIIIGENLQKSVLESDKYLIIGDVNDVGKLWHVKLWRWTISGNETIKYCNWLRSTKLSISSQNKFSNFDTNFV